MSKVGIVTFYYNSTNYGGNFQAYALCRYLNKHGIDAEQISFEYTKNRTGESLVHRIMRKGVAETLCDVIGVVFKKINKKKLANIRRNRMRAFKRFQTEAIPHSNRVYNYADISEAGNLYDVFITGSDQVWNSYDSIYFLDFLDGEKKKFSYAASNAKGYWSETEKLLIKSALSDYCGISVRDEATMRAVEATTGESAVVTVDPTLLLDKEDWDEVKEQVEAAKKYILCYFLGNNKRARCVAKEYARNHGCTVINIPMYNGGISRVDKVFGESVYDASPGQFLSYIENAECVFTDSFHCVVFSHIYSKQYYVFNRNARGAMNSRIKDITTLFGTEEYFCDEKSKESISYIEGLKEIDFKNNIKKIEKLADESKQFLHSCLAE